MYKPPWQMTRGEYVTLTLYPQSPTNYEPGIVEYYRQQHKAEVRLALQRGENVPATVTEDYPDLLKKGMKQ